MKDNDNELIDTVDKWKEKEFKLKQEKIKNRKELWSKFIDKFFVWLKYVSVVVGICFLIFGILVPNCNNYNKNRAEQKFKYSEALKECVEKIGMNVCKRISEPSEPGSHCRYQDELITNYGKCLIELDAEKCNLIKSWNDHLHFSE